MSLIKLLFEFNITDQTDAVERIMSLIDYDAKKISSYITSGFWGDVFKVEGKNKIIKLTNSMQEFHTAQMLVDEEFDHVINIFFAKEVRWYKDGVYLIVAEYLDNADQELKFFRNGSELEYISMDVLDDYARNSRRAESIKKVKDNEDHMVKTIVDNVSEDGSYDADMVQSFLSNIKREAINDDLWACILYRTYLDSVKRGVGFAVSKMSKNMKVLNDLIKGIEELDSIELKHTDLHFENVMKDPKTGNYKLIDIQ